MTNLKICGKKHLFIIISVLIIAIGMAVGTICHFCAGGFFNYGDEFRSYKSVTVTYYASEYTEAKISPVCENALSGLGAYEVSLGDGEIVYKFSKNADTAKLQSAVDTLNTKFDGLETNASLHEGAVNEGGARALRLAAIVAASAVGAQFIYFIFRYKLRSAYSVLLASVHNLGVFVSLVAITRIPVGTDLIAFGVLTVFITIAMTCLFFDRTKKNFKNEKFAKSDAVDVIELSASEVRRVTFVSFCALAVVAAIYEIFAVIAALNASALAPFAAFIFMILSCAYGVMFFTPAVHVLIDGACTKAKNLIKSRKAEKAKLKQVKEQKPAKEKA